MGLTAEADLRKAIRVYRKMKREDRKVDGVDQTPGCVFGVVTREVLDGVAADLEEIKGELRWIRRLIVGGVGTAIIATVLRFAGLE